MGATCVRDCERTAHELYSSEDAVPVQAGMPGLQNVVGPNTQGDRDVKVGAAFGNPLAAISGRGESSTGGTATVPPLFGMKALQQMDQMTPRETPRFDEVTPRAGSVPPETYRSNPGSARDSPRPPEERRENGPVELSYEGEMLDDMKHGTGRLRMQGSSYEGDFKNDVKSGQGVLTWDDGRQYRGQFEDDKFHGSAVMTWPDGRKYCGQYVEDRKHGEGTFSWQDGRRYQGQWVVGKRHGVGVYTNAKGLTRTGLWQMDRPLHWEAPNSASSLPSSVPVQAPENTPEKAEEEEQPDPQNPTVHPRQEEKTTISLQV